MPRLEFFTYLDEIRKDRKEAIEPLVCEGLAVATNKSQWGYKYDPRSSDPLFRIVATAKRAANVRASYENADARIRARSGSAESSRIAHQ